LAFGVHVAVSCCCPQSPSLSRSIRCRFKAFPRNDRRWRTVSSRVHCHLIQHAIIMRSSLFDQGPPKIVRLLASGSGQMSGNEVVCRYSTIYGLSIRSPPRRKEGWECRKPRCSDGSALGSPRKAAGQIRQNISWCRRDCRLRPVYSATLRATANSDTTLPSNARLTMKCRGIRC